ncbi:hypothetical protein JTB14_020051 [Gonioctena quinquepunctata]|nr:hypothetical protein JTB14_020051 [Gonioctena quinquepunctata]
MTSRTRDKTDKIKLQDTDVEELISRVCAEFNSKIEKSFDSKFSKMEKQLASIATALSNTSKCAFQNKIEMSDCGESDGRQDVAKPRPIIVKFITNIEKNEIIGARKLLKNENISVFEDLSKKTFQLLKMAKEKVGPKKAWSLGGKIFVWNEKHNKKIIINNEQDILDIDA